MKSYVYYISEKSHGHPWATIYRFDVATGVGEAILANYADNWEPTEVTSENCYYHGMDEITEGEADQRIANAIRVVFSDDAEAKLAKIQAALDECDRAIAMEYADIGAQEMNFLAEVRRIMQ